MKLVRMALAPIALIGCAAPVFADPTVDGIKDAQYISSKSVTYSPIAPTSNFDAPTPLSDTANYTISLFGGTDRVFGYLKADRDTGIPFANLYFDLNPSVGDGSDLGFELSSGRANAFVAGRNGQPGFQTLIDPSMFSVFATGDTVEFSLANSLFTGPIPGLTYFDGQTFTAGSEPLTLRLSQSFGYAVAGGATYGSDRLGAFSVGGTANGAVPEPATWMMMILGFGAIGYGMRRRRKVTTKIAYVV